MRPTAYPNRHEAAHLPAEADAETPLFTNPRTGKRLSHWALRNGWIKAANRAGVDAPLYERTKHSFATDALDRTGNARGVQAVLGHSDPRSTEAYAKLKDRAMAEVVGVRTVH